MLLTVNWKPSTPQCGITFLSRFPKPQRVGSLITDLSHPPYASNPMDSCMEDMRAYWLTRLISVGYVKPSLPTTPNEEDTAMIPPAWCSSKWLVTWTAVETFRVSVISYGIMPREHPYAAMPVFLASVFPVGPISRTFISVWERRVTFVSCMAWFTWPPNWAW